MTSVHGTVENREASGISYIGLETTPYLVSAETISEHLGIEVGRIKAGLGINMFRFPGFSDTHVTIGANNLLRFVGNLFKQKLLLDHFEEYGIGAFYVATESSTESSRSLTAAILEIVEPVLIHKSKSLNSDKKEVIKRFITEMRGADTLETKFACTALSKTIFTLNQGLISGSMAGAIILGTDIAIYDHKKAPNAEATQGGGSALLYLTKDPLLVKLDNRAAHFNLSTYDFYKQDDHIPTVSSGFGSKVNYVVTLGTAFKKYEQKFGMSKDSYFVSHVPYRMEAEYNASFIYVHWLKKYNPEKLRKIEQKIGMSEPIGTSPGAIAYLLEVIKSHYQASKNGEITLMEFLNQHAGVKELWAYHQKMRKTEEFRRFKEGFGLDQALKISGYAGNWYNGSMWVAAGSLIREIIQEKAKAKDIYFGSYGSGSASTIFKGEMITGLDKKEQLALIEVASFKYGEKLSLEQYKAIHDSKLEKNEYCEKGNNLILKDKELLRDKSAELGFKLICYDSRREGRYAYNGKEIQKGPIIMKTE